MQHITNGTMNPPSTVNQSYYINVLNVVSAMAVVFLHTNGIFWTHPSGSTWISANIIESVFIFAVPIFFMISGCTLVDYSKRYSTRTFFIKRIKKVVLPFIFWTIVAMIYCYCSHKKGLEWTLEGIIDGIIKNKYMGIYWFFMPLFAMYLAMPVLTNIQNKIKIFSYMALWALITVSLIPFIKPFGFHYLPPALNTPISSGILLFPLIGYVIHHIEIPRKWRIGLYIIGLCCVSCHCFFTIYLSPAGEPICKYFKGTTLLPNVLYAISVFVFIKYNTQRFFSSQKAQQFINFVKPTTFGVYLIHQYFIYIASKWGIDSSSIIYRTVGALIIFLLCVLLVRLIQKSAFGRWVLP